MFHKKATAIAAILATFAALPASGAYAADAQGTVRQDFTQLSHAGNRAMTDVATARAALFEGNPDAAAKLLKDAKTAMRAAKTDDTAFVKAESELTNPAGTRAATPDASKPVAWLPFGADAVVLDDFSAQPAKAKAVADADAALKKGHRDDAVKALKLADVNMAISVAVVPLSQTESRIEMASSLLDAGKYYEAGQVLHQVEDSIRIDTLDINAIPKTVKK